MFLIISNNVQLLASYIDRAEADEALKNNREAFADAPVTLALFAQVDPAPEASQVDPAPEASQVDPAPEASQVDPAPEASQVDPVE